MTAITADRDPDRCMCGLYVCLKHRLFDGEIRDGLRADHGLPGERAVQLCEGATSVSRTTRRDTWWGEHHSPGGEVGDI